MSRYEVFDAETTTKTSFKRKANAFDPDNWVVLRQYKVQGEQATYHYFGAASNKAGQVVPEDKTYNLRTPMYIPEDVTILVGHNIKFDLLWTWEVPGLREFLKRGGTIWDTQYAEYLLQGAERTWHMNSLNDCCNLYGMPPKEDAVKAFWDAGYDTWQIPPDVLISYGLGDVDRTEGVFKGQWEKAVKFNMLGMILQRMEGLLATTEMEYNGIWVNKAKGLEAAKVAYAEVEVLRKELDQYFPKNMPADLQFSWKSRFHKSALFYGGRIKYEKRVPVLDENGQQVYAKKKLVHWVVDDQDGSGEKLGFPCEAQPEPPVNVVRFKGGKNAGMPKTKQSDVNDTDKPKSRMEEFYYDFPQLVQPEASWEYAGDPGFYSTDADTMEKLAERGVPFVTAFMKLQKMEKDVGTYYITYDEDGNEKGGMLSLVYPNGLLHHKLNHTSTVTTRLSSSDPNAQNFPRADTSRLKELFESRFGADGRMVEVDYSQLEVVIQGMLSGDPQLRADLRARIDFHCKRVAARFGCTYEEAFNWCKVQEIPEWKVRRTNCKEFSFQRAYGAGAVAISLSTGIPVDDVEAMIEAEEAMYPGVVDYAANCQRQIEDSAVEVDVFHRSRINPSLVVRAKRGTLVVPTGTRYTFTQAEAPKFLQKRGVVASFSPTEIKNYPIQGTGGEGVQMTAGRLFRWFLMNDNFATDGNWRNGRAFLINTVHDCFWADARAEIAEAIAKTMKAIMEQLPDVFNKLYPHMAVDVPFPAEAEIGINLFDKHTVH